jgi:hypothetical protein
MKKNSPLVSDDAEIFFVHQHEIEFTLNARKIFDRGFGVRFNESVVSSLNASVGFFHHTADVSVDDDSLLERFFSALIDAGVAGIYAIPTGYPHAIDNENSMEIVEYEPPLIGKINPTLQQFSKVRGGMIGLYSGRHYLFSSCLGYALLDVNGYYSLILGPKDFVQKVLGVSIEDSWASVWKEGVIDPSVIEGLREAFTAYSCNEAPGN